MMRLDNYAFVRMKEGKKGACGLTTECDNKNVAEDSNYYVAIMGEVYGREDFKDGTVIYTSPVKESTEEYAITTSGTKYMLGRKDCDYVKFEDAVRNGIPILNDWEIVVTHDEGICIKGTLWETSDPFQKKVDYQVGPMLKLSDGTCIFVDWISISKETLSRMQVAVDGGLVRLTPFCHIGIEPFVMKEDWAIVNSMGDFLLS